MYLHCVLKKTFHIEIGHFLEKLWHVTKISCQLPMYIYNKNSEDVVLYNKALYLISYAVRNLILLLLVKLELVI